MYGRRVVGVTEETAFCCSNIFVLCVAWSVFSVVDGVILPLSISLETVADDEEMLFLLARGKQ